MLLEDDVRLRDLIQRGLTESGHRVEVSKTVSEGLNLALSEEFDALILDVMLMDQKDAGFELTQRLRDEGVRTPVLFLTARADMDSRLQGLNVGGDDYLSKPIDIALLKSMLIRWLPSDAVVKE